MRTDNIRKTTNLAIKLLTTDEFFVKFVQRKFCVKQIIVKVGQKGSRDSETITHQVFGRTLQC